MRQYLIPFRKTDVKVYISYMDENWNEIRQELGIVNDIPSNLNEGGYHILPDGVPEGITDYAYLF